MPPLTTPLALSQKRGRPTINEREEVFEDIVEYLCQNDDEQITFSKINDMMKDEGESFR